MEFKDFSRLCEVFIDLEGIKSANLKFQFLLYIFAASHLAFVKRTNARLTEMMGIDGVIGLL